MAIIDFTKKVALYYPNLPKEEKEKLEETELGTYIFGALNAFCPEDKNKDAYNSVMLKVMRTPEKIELKPQEAIVLLEAIDRKVQPRDQNGRPVPGFEDRAAVPGVVRAVISEMVNK